MYEIKDRADIRKEISNFCKKVSWSQTVVGLCEHAKENEELFLHSAFKSELKNREQSRKKRYLKNAAFPTYKTLENYDFSQVKIPKSLNKEDLINGNLIKSARNLVLYGPVGTGKTHLATAIGIKTCNLGYPVRYFTVAELVTRLYDSLKDGTLDKVITNILKSKLIILDELGYVPIHKEGAQLLFRIITDSYERRSIIITTNIEFSKWGSIFMDEQMAVAMIDRLAHHGHLILFEGDSYRMKNALMKEN